MRVVKALAVVLAMATVQVASGRIKGGDHPSPPTSDYVVKDILGWRIYVQRTLLDKEKELGDRALHLLDSHLFAITRAVPGAALAELRKVKIWVHHKGRGNVGQYHPSRGWLEANGFNVDMTRCVDMGDAENFLRSSKRQPWMVLHELAHAYHDQVWGWGNADVKNAYRKAFESGKYDNVLIWNGRKGKAYAMSNPMEYFAESSEAYLGANDFYPFVRAELNEHDPDMVKVLEKLWAGPPAKEDSPQR